MRDLFHGYYPPSDEEMEELWSSGSIILDTNALLNLYRYSDETRMEFLSVLEILKNRLWIPAQVGKEFQVGRIGAIETQRGAYGEIQKALETAHNSFENAVKKFKQHPFLNADDLLKQYDDAITALGSELSAKEMLHANTFDRGYMNDDVWDRVTALFNGRVGEPYSDEELADITSAGSKRYAAKIPPGYSDISKGEPAQYGDLILWQQLLHRSKTKKDAAIFVTGDRKEDWWRIVSGKHLGPRPELVHEYFACSGKRIHFYSPDQFLKYAKQRVTTAEVSDRSIGEVKQVSEQTAEDRLHVSDEVYAEWLRHIVPPGSSRRPIQTGTHMPFHRDGEGLIETHEQWQRMQRDAELYDWMEPLIVYPRSSDDEIVRFRSSRVEMLKARVDELHERYGELVQHRRTAGSRLSETQLQAIHEQIREIQSEIQHTLRLLRELD